MIEQIDIANFRAFSRPVTIRLRPITILIGRNSAGKSTLMKFLLMLRQTLETTEGDFLVTEGRHVTLGALRDQQNTNPGFEGRRLAFRLLARTQSGPSATLAQLLATINSQLAKGSGARDVKLPFTPNHDKRISDGATYTIEGEVPYLRPTTGWHAVKCEGSAKPPIELRAKSLNGARFLSFPANTTRPEGELAALIQNGFLRPAREVLLETRHLSPVRREAQRVVMLANAPEDDVGHEGEFAVQQLHRLLRRNGKTSAFLKHQIKAIANIDSLAFEEQTAQLLSHFQGRNLDTLATCHLNDFGFGVSQCLPVLVQGCLLKKGQLLMVEQPEAQIHPTAQLELGSFFVDLWHAMGVRSLIETHSANIILRLRQLVSNKRLAPEDVSIAYFTTEDHHVVVRNLDIYPGGRLEKGLPREFFGADLLELAKFGLPQ